MKIPVIKILVEGYSMEELQQAEDAIINEATPTIAISGDDEGEQLTHAMAAIWIKHQMANEGVNFNNALRQYTVRVRTSIS